MSSSTFKDGVKCILFIDDDQVVSLGFACIPDGMCEIFTITSKGLPTKDFSYNTLVDGVIPLRLYTVGPRTKDVTIHLFRTSSGEECELRL